MFVANGFLISLPVHVCMLFILSSNNNYVCFARVLCTVLICDNGTPPTWHTHRSFSRETTTSVLSSCSRFCWLSVPRSNMKLLSYLYLQQWRWFVVSHRPNPAIKKSSQSRTDTHTRRERVRANERTNIDVRKIWKDAADPLNNLVLN